MKVRDWLAWRRFAILFGLLLVLGTAGLANNAANNAAIEERMRQDITYLASAECEGRGVDTEGIHRAANYIANEFKKAGLKPGGPKGSWFQPFAIADGPAKAAGPASVRLRGPLGQEIELTSGADFQVLGLSGSGTAKAPLVFLGYGATAPRIGYDDYQGIDVAGKIVVVLRRLPRWSNDNVPFDGENKLEHWTERRKLVLAELNRAAAVLFVNDASLDNKGDPLINFGQFSSESFAAVLPAVQIRRNVIDGILRSSLGAGLRDLEQDIDRNLKPRSAVLSGWTAAIETKVVRGKIAAKNVIGVLEGAGPLANETVVIGAHYDHLGYGLPGRPAKTPGKRAIHHGADDNASGTTAVIELARRFGQIKDRQGRRIVFMTFSGEEMGLLGSRYYCDKNPLFALKDTVAMVNLDMIGRLPTENDKKGDKKTDRVIDTLIVEGVKTARGFEELVEKLNEKYAFKLAKKAGDSNYSDHAAFYSHKVPVLFLWNDTHLDYHKPGDTADKINIAGMRRITDLAEECIAHFASVRERPEYLAIASKGTKTRPKSNRPSLGILPSYGDEGPGVLASQVFEGRAADNAGLKSGDRIIELAGKEVRNLDFYTAILELHLRGQTVEVAVLRGDKRLTFKVTLE